jgi:predicted nuclease of restriction endonuclease-like (RecB) superfamily
MKKKKKNELLPSGYLKLLEDIKKRAREAQSRATQKVNHELVALYWTIGKSIDKKIQEENWGDAVIETLEKDLQKEFSGSLGFSKSNLYRMVSFYRTTQENPIFPTLSGKLSWSHITLLLAEFKDKQRLNFYAEKASEQGWSVRVLTHQIELKNFERTVKSQNNFKAVLPKRSDKNLLPIVKDEYVFDFLGLEEEFSERDLEQALLKKINAFLIEMGGVFTYVGNQYRLTVDGDVFFIDVLLFHRKLRCLVAIELKIGEFKPEYAGKMQFYLTALNEQVKQSGENPSIGIILCKSKKRTIVEYALKNAKQPMAVATYRLTTELPKNLKKELPSQKQMESLFEIKEEIFPTLSGKLTSKRKMSSR